MGRDANTAGEGDEVPEHKATVASFALDKYEVTVGRFRNFLNAYDAWRLAGNPTDKAGAHPFAVDTGWEESWTPASMDLAATADAIKAAWTSDSNSNCSWTATAGTSAAESNPINCVTWYEAFAFCIWDGGRLPTEAEWEYAAAGGSESRLYPWVDITLNTTRANYTADSVGTPKKSVGSYPAGAGYFTHADLAGSMWEWVFDWYKSDYYGTSGSPIECENCANATNETNATDDRPRVIRGGSWNSTAKLLRAANRSPYRPDVRSDTFGFRCARTP